jgi:hypothetical protein
VYEAAAASNEYKSEQREIVVAQEAHFNLSARYYQESWGWILPERQLREATMSDDEEVQPPPSHCKVLLAGTLSKKLQAEVKAGVEKLRKTPTLVGFLSSSDPAARVYAQWTGKTAEEQ